MLTGDSVSFISWIALSSSTLIQEVLLEAILWLNLQYESGLFVAQVSYLKRVVFGTSSPPVAPDTSPGAIYFFGFVDCVISFSISWYQLCGADLLREFLIVFIWLFNLSWSKCSSSAFVREVLFVVNLFLVLVSLFYAGSQSVGGFLIYKVAGEVVEVARWNLRSYPSPCFVSLTRGTLFLFLCFLGLGNTPRPNRFGKYPPSFFVSLFCVQWISRHFVLTIRVGPANSRRGTSRIVS